eukprot:jgi/Tetstr1/454007/TSEL_040926.t1
MYDRAKRDVYKEHPTHSAYRSGLLVRTYKARFARKYGKGEPPYRGPRPSASDKGLRRWFAEGWVNESGGVGYDRRNRLYRPSKRVTRDTPVTWGELTESEVRRARAEKQRTGRVRSFRDVAGR